MSSSTPVGRWHPGALTMLIVAAVCLVVGVVLIFTGPSIVATVLIIVAAVLAAISGYANRALLRRKA